jgi:hypothetical protein
MFYCVVYGGSLLYLLTPQGRGSVRYKRKLYQQKQYFSTIILYLYRRVCYALLFNDFGCVVKLLEKAFPSVL